MKPNQRVTIVTNPTTQRRTIITTPAVQTPQTVVQTPSQTAPEPAPVPPLVSPSIPVAEVPKKKKPQPVIVNIQGMIGKPDVTRANTFDDLVAAIEPHRQTASEVIVNLMSVGGKASDAIKMYDYLSELPFAVTTRCFGDCASATTIIAQGGNTREIHKDSRYLIHKTSMQTEGNADELSADAEHLMRYDAVVAEIYARRGTLTKRQYMNIMSAKDGEGKWLSPAEAIELGLADCITDVVNPMEE